MDDNTNIEFEKSGSSICVGITGGFGSGKTSAAKIIEGEGYKVIYTDDLAKDIMNNDDNVKQKIIDTFGKETYSDGKLNSAFLAGLVFSELKESEKKIEQLDKIVHPPVIERMMKLVDEYESQGEKLIFVESALIYEVNLDEGFEYIISVSASEENVKERATSRGLSEQQLKNRLDKQLPPDKKAQWADFSIENNGNFDQLRSSTLMILEILKVM